MRRLTVFLIPTLALGTMLATGCAEHRYQTYDPYYGHGGYYGADDPYYRQWLAERRYSYIEYNRLNRERQRDYWEWRRQNEARFRNDPRFRNNPGVVRNDHDRDDRGNGNRQVARDRDGDRDRHKADRDRHQVRNDKNRNRDHDNRRDKDHDRDRDHDKR